MRVGLVTTWGAFCGISTYSEQLASAFTNIKPVALIPPNEDETMRHVVPGYESRADKAPADIPTDDAWARLPPGAPVDVEWAAKGFEATVKRRELDVVHFQHEEGIWPDHGYFLEMCAAARRVGAAVIVTLHTVFPFGGDLARTGFYHRLSHVAHHIVVHTIAARAAIGHVEGRAHVCCIPHGTPQDLERGDRTAGLKSLGIKEGIVGLVFGFGHPTKNVCGTVRAFGLARAQELIDARAYLAIVGKGVSRDEVLQTMIRWTGYEDHIRCIDAYIEDPTDIFAAADYGILNTTSNTLSASGQVHLYLAHNVPIAVARRPIYDDALQAGQLGFAINPTSPEEPTQEAVSSIAALGMARIRGDQLRARLRANMHDYVKETNWGEIATAHARLYQFKHSTVGLT